MKTYIKNTYLLEKPSIFPQYFLGLSLTTDESKRLLSHQVDETIIHFVDTQATMYIEKESFKGLAEFLIENLQKPKEFNDLVSDIKQEYSIVENFVQKIKSLDPSNLTIDELFNLWSEYNRKLNTFRVYAAIPNHVSQEGFNLIELYRNLIDSKEDISNNDFDLLTANEELSGVSESERSLLLLLNKEGGYSESDLSKWIQDYGYIYYYYTGPLPTIHSVKVMLQRLSDAYPNIKERITFLDNYEKQASEGIQFVIDKYKLDDRTQHLARVLRFLKLYKAQRKEFMQKTYVVMDDILGEIAQRYSIKLDDLKMFTYEEIKKIVSERDLEFLEKQAQERRKLFLITTHGDKVSILDTENEINEFLAKKVFPEQVKKQKKQGTVSSIGETVEGKLIFINSQDDFQKIEVLSKDENFILGSFSTYPDLLPVMVKSSGIITKVGGMTSHAAIVARELKKPCIVGYNTLMDDFKEGDLIELDTQNCKIKKID